MAYLTLDGVTVHVALDSVTLRYVNAGGDEERSPSGSLEGGPLVLKREWAMATTPVLASELDAWVGLIEGKGHSVPLDLDTYTGRGRAAYVLSVGTSVITTAGKWGGYLLLPTSGTGSWKVLDLVSTSPWSALLWRFDSGAWHHYVARSAGTVWRDGVSSPSTVQADFVRRSVGEPNALVLGDFTGAGLRSFDDVVFLPYLLPDAWLAGMYARHNTAAWPTLPRVLAAGDFASSSVTVRGKVTDTRALRYAPSGTPTTGYTIQFTLREV